MSRPPDAPRDARVTAHKPASLPLQARFKSTMNWHAARSVPVEHNLIARRVVEYLHARIIDDPAPFQTYRHDDVGAALGIDPKKVRLSLAHAGCQSITVAVTAKDRAAIRKLPKERRQ